MTPNARPPRSSPASAPAGTHALSRKAPAAASRAAPVEVVAPLALALAAVLTLLAPPALAGQRPAPSAEGDADTARARAELPADAVTRHEVTIDGKSVAYTATAGSITLRDEEGEATAEVYYTAYTRDGVEDPAGRPLTFAYNGGPGSASVWLHLGALGPRRVHVPDTAYAPPPPYRLVDNDRSPLDVTDLVFVDPVGTGFSRPVGEARGDDFWGVDEDVRSVAEFIRRYVTENDRWNSPRYLLGESYGTTRSAALVDHLQSQMSMDFNGVVLVSVVLDFQTISFRGTNELPYILYLPSYAATSWYHDVLPGERPPRLGPFLREVEDFATGEYARALMAGSALEGAERRDVVSSLHRYTGLSEEYLDRADLRVDNSEYEQELLRGRDVVVARLDARFRGPAEDPLAQRALRDPQSDAVSSAFATALRHYVRRELGFRTERRYRVLGDVRPWDWETGRSGGWPGFTDVSGDLADAMESNPHLEVLVFNGLYDLATPYFASVYTMRHLGLPPDLRDQIHRVDFEAGHMMYLHPPSLERMKEELEAFITGTSGGEEPARRTDDGRGG